MATKPPKRWTTSSSNNCLVCLNSFKRVVFSGESRAQEELYEKIYHRFIKVVKRYLQVKTIEDEDGGQFLKRFSNQVISDDEDQSQNKVPRFCDSCLNTVTKVCDLYHELCTARVRLGSKLGKLGELIEKGNRSNNYVADDTLDHHHQQLLINPAVAEDEAVQEFRQSIAFKCLQKFKEAGPQVLIIDTGTPTPCLNIGEQEDIAMVEMRSDDEVSLEEESSSESEEDMDWEGPDDSFHISESEQEEINEIDTLEDNNDFKRLFNSEDKPIENSTNSSKKSEEASGSSRARKCRKMRKSRRRNNEEDEEEEEEEKSDASQEMKTTERKRKIKSRVLKSPTEMLACSHCDQLFSSTTILQLHLNKVKGNKNGKTFQCCFCWKSFGLEQSHLLHLQTKHSHHSLPCDESSCRESFGTLQELNEHLLNHSPLESLHFCSKCNLGCLSSAYLTLHGLSHVPRSKTKFKCGSCPKKFAKFVIFRDHYNLKHGQKLPVHKCSKCESACVTFERLRNHMNSHDPDPKPKVNRRIPPPAETEDDPLLIRCSECPKTFIDETRLNFHRWCHSSRSCSICSTGTRFRKFEDFKMHMKQVHNEDVLETCHICQKTLKSRISLIKHLRIMHGPQTKDHLCPYCGRGYRDTIYLREHVSRYHPEHHAMKVEAKHSCPHCEKKFFRITILRSHLGKCEKNPDRIPEPVLPAIVKQTCSGRLNTCATCGLLVKNGTLGMRRHLKTHLPKAQREKFECRICGVNFSHKGTLRTHLRDKHDVQDKLCQDCGALYFPMDGGKHLCSQMKKSKEGYHHFNRQQPQLVDEGVAQFLTKRDGRQYHIEVFEGTPKLETSE